MSFNPFWNLHYRITGGRRTILIYLGLFIVLMAAVWYVTYRFHLSEYNGQPSQRQRDELLGKASATALIWVSVAQGAFVLLMAPFAIRKAVMRDSENGMLESHQLAPMNGLRIALGYLTGPPIVSWLLFATGLLMGVIFAGLRAKGVGALPGSAAGQWFGTQLVFLSLSVLYCTATLLLSLHSPKKSVTSPFLLVFFLPFLVPLSPGVAILIGAAGLVLFSGMTTGIGPSAQMVTETIALSVLAQAAFALLFLFAASQKVRANRMTVFGVPLGALFVGLFGVVSLAGIRLSLIDSSARSNVSEMADVYIVATSILMMFLAYYPLRAAAVSMVQFVRRGAIGRGGLLTRFFVLAAILTSFVVGTFLAGAQLISQSKINWAEITRLISHGAVPLAIFATFVFDLAILYRAALRGKSGIAFLLFLILVLRGAPFIIDGIFAYQSQVDVYSEPEFEYKASQISPYVTMIMAVGDAGNPWPGTVVQVVLTIAALGWALSTKPKVKSAPQRVPVARPAPPVQTPSGG
ncbi:MAG: hypothetical protein AB7N71_06140 [Phycisphaerae bacterium]